MRLLSALFFLLLFSVSSSSAAPEIDVWFLEPVNKSEDYDFDLEQRQYVAAAIAPLAKIARIRKQLQIFIERDDAINAYVLVNDQINLNSGLLFFGASPLGLQAVVAHEISHAINNHFLVFSEEATIQSVISLANLLVGLSLSAALFTNEDTANAAPPVLLSSLISSQHNYARGVFSSFRRSEQAADVAAVSLLQKAGIETSGLAEIFHHFDESNPTIPSYLREWITHPDARERTRSVEINRQDLDANLQTELLLSPLSSPLPPKGVKVDQKAKNSLQKIMNLARESYKAKTASAIESSWRGFTAQVTEDNFPSAYAHLVGLIAKKNYSAGLVLVEDLLTQQPDHNLLLFQQGRVLLYLQQPAAAENLFKQLHTKNQDEAAYKIYLAKAYLAQSGQAKQQKAQAILEALTFSEKSSAQVLYSSWNLLQQLHQAQGNQELASLSFALALFADVTSRLQVSFTSGVNKPNRASILAILSKLRFITRSLETATLALDLQTPYGRKALLAKKQALELDKALRQLAL